MFKKYPKIASCGFPFLNRFVFLISKEVKLYVHVYAVKACVFDINFLHIYVYGEVFNYDTNHKMCSEIKFPLPIGKVVDSVD